MGTCMKQVLVLPECNRVIFSTPYDSLIFRPHETKIAKTKIMGMDSFKFMAYHCGLRLEVSIKIPGSFSI